MIPIDLDALNLDPQLIARLDAATNEVRGIIGLKQKYEYIDRHRNLWHNTLNSLAQLTNNTEDNCKCWYCECDGSAGFYFQVDHFRPKNRVRNKGYKKGQYEPGYWWLAFSPKNYRVACQRCNTGAGKRDQFPLADGLGSFRAICEGGEEKEKSLLLDPISPTDPDLLMFSEDGDVHAVPECFDDDKIRVEVSIRVYNLRARGKRETRRRLWKECYKFIISAREAYDFLKESLLLTELEKSARKDRFREACTKIKKMTLRNAKFSSTVKSCIREYYKVEEARSRVENRLLDLNWLLNLL